MVTSSISMKASFGSYSTGNDSLQRWNCTHLLEFSPPNFNDINRTISRHGLWILVYVDSHWH